MSKKDFEFFGDKDVEVELEELVTEEVEDEVELEAQDEVAVEVASPEITSIQDYTVEKPEFANMTDVAIREWLAWHPNLPAEEKINGYEVRVWKLARKFNVSVEKMSALIEKNPHVLK